MSSTHCTIGQAITGKPGTNQWCSTLKPGIRLKLFGMMAAPSGNSPIFRRWRFSGVDHVGAALAFARHVGAALRDQPGRLRMQQQGPAERLRRRLPRQVVRRRADAAEAEHHVGRGEALLERVDEELVVVARDSAPRSA